MGSGGAVKIFQRYIIYNYFKNFFVIFLSLEFFYVGVDLLSNYKDLPDSANLQLLYIVFKSLDAVNYATPLSIVFAMIVTKFSMIRSNELVTLYSVGVTKRAIILPLFLSALFISLAYMALNLTSFANAYEYSSNLRKYKTIARNSQDLFFKNNNQYIYFKRLDPIKKQASDVRIFTVEDNDMVQIVNAKRAYFYDDKWVLKEVNIKHKPQNLSLGSEGLVAQDMNSFETLQDFRPKIIENIHKGQYNMSILDTIGALVFFSSQEVNLDRIKTLLYSHLLFPLFAPLMIVILFYKLPVNNRFFNLALLSFIFVFITLCIWGILFILTKLSATSVIIPEIGVVVPIILLALLALRFYTLEKQ